MIDGTNIATVEAFDMANGMQSEHAREIDLANSRAHLIEVLDRQSEGMQVETLGACARLDSIRLQLSVFSYEVREFRHSLALKPALHDCKLRLPE